MDQAFVKRVKFAWGALGVGVTVLVLVEWGVTAAATAALAYVGVSFLAFVAFILYLLLVDVPVVWRVLIIAALFLGLFVEVGALVTVLGWLLHGEPG
jgi:hypothetical protein